MTARVAPASTMRRLLVLAALSTTAAQSGVVGAGLCRNMYYQVPWDTLDYEGVVPSEFACSSACVQTAEQQGVPGTCAGLLAVALYMQEVMGLNPCYLCIVQRVFVIAVGALAPLRLQ